MPKKKFLNNYTMIKLNVDTLEMLRQLKVSSETYDHIIRRMIGKEGVNVYFDILSVDGDDRPQRHEVVFRLGEAVYRYQGGRFYIMKTIHDDWRRAKWVEV